MAANIYAQQNSNESTAFLYEMIMEDMWTPWEAAMNYFNYTPWLFSLLGSTVVGLTGIFPLIVIPIEGGVDLQNGDGAEMLKILLSFAVGGLLGDVFLHLLPEAWGNSSLKGTDAGHPSMNCGLWLLGGFLVFVIVEKLFAFEQEAENEEQECEKTNDVAEKEMENNNCIDLIGNSPKNGFTKPVNGYKDTYKNGFVSNGIKPVLICDELANTLKDLPLNEAKDYLSKLTKSNGFSTSLSKECAKRNNVNNQTVAKKEKSKHITGYLNLLANIIDNFTHGLAVGGSFLVSFRLGALTTFAILVHEIPHEVGDFAILLRSGFSRWDAARAQMITATGGIFGAMSAVIFSGGEVGAKTSWILPFTAGGFLHIGMVTILPELLKESSPKQSLKQLLALFFGIVVMAMLTILCD